MGLFQENNNDELALLRAEIDRLKSQVGEQKQTKSAEAERIGVHSSDCLLYTSPSPRDRTRSRMPSSA